MAILELETNDSSNSAVGTQYNYTGPECLIFNQGSYDLFVGGSTVSSTTGLRIASGEILRLLLDEPQQVFAITRGGETGSFTVAGFRATT